MTSLEESSTHQGEPLEFEDGDELIEEEDEIEDDINEMSKDLDQIGMINFNFLPSYLSTEKLLSQMPSFEMKNFSHEFSKYVTRYKNYYYHQQQQQQNKEGNDDNDDLVNTDTNEETDGNIIDAIKTAVSTRIQMNKFLNDLKLGVNFTTAIERLQPLTEVINETIFLPDDDDEDYDNNDYGKEEEDDVDDQKENIVDLIEDEEITEPVGIEKIVNKSQPLINEIVKPGENQFDKSRKRRKNNRYLNKFYHHHIDSGLTSQTSDVDGLSIDEVRELTELNSLDDFAKQDVLRNRIKKIQNLSIGQNSKNKLVTKLMMGNYYKYINEKLSEDDKHLLKPLKSEKLVINESELLDNVDEEMNEQQQQQEDQESIEEDEGSDDEVILTEHDLQASYHDSLNTIFGCQHYQTNCKIECPTCFKWYSCRFCHDSDSTNIDHKLIRNEVKHILCMHCNTPQIPESNYCINCELELANYFCSKCILYDNDQTKDIYHCDKCGICRLGLGLDKDYFHCETCNTCLSIDLKGRHKCLSDVTHSNCCICNEDLFSLIHKVVFMKCGHSIHEHCYIKFTKFSSKCPICKKTITNVESQYRILDVEINQNPLPAPYNSWRCIISCNDCGGKCNTSYHILGLKCKYCNSYNTNQLKLIKPEEEEQEEEEEEEEQEQEGQGVENSRNSFDVNIMKLVKTNLLNNFGIDERQMEEEEDDDEKSGYEDDMEEEEEDNEKDDYDYEGDDEMGNFINLKKFGDRGSDNISYITSMFQNFVNKTLQNNNNHQEEEDE